MVAEWQEFQHGTNFDHVVAWDEFGYCTSLGRVGCHEFCLVAVCCTSCLDLLRVCRSFVDKFQGPGRDHHKLERKPSSRKDFW